MFSYILWSFKNLVFVRTGVGSTDSLIFDCVSERNRSYECTSFVETQATALLKAFPVEFVKYPL